MYHIGKVIEIFSNDDRNVVAFENSTQALLDMWDENLITLSIDPHISKSIKKDDVLLVDYTPGDKGPKMVAVKVLRGDVAKRSWKRYKEHFEKLRAGKASQVRNSVKQSYVG